MHADAPADAPSEPAGGFVASRARRVVVRATLILATILAIFAIFAIWANRQLLQPTNWASTSTALLQKPTIRAAVAGFLVDQLYAHVNVAEKLKSGLPSELKPLAEPAAGALHGVVETAAERLLESPNVQAAWRRANRAADQTLVAVVNGGGSRVKVEGGTVSLNLHQIVTDLSQRLGLDSGIVEKLPASFAQVKVISSSQLGLVRNLAKALHALAILLTVLVCGCYALALALARGHRRRTLMWIGGSLVLAGLVVLVARRIAQGQIVSAVTSDASIEPAANDAYSVATSLLVQVASSSILLGVPLICAAWFAGPARRAVAGRRFLAPHLQHRPALVYWVTVGLLALVFIWAPIPATRNPLEMLLLALVAFAGAHVLREQIAREFPDAETVSVRAAIREHVHAVGERAARLPASYLGAREGGGQSTAAELERLFALREKGALTDEEYTAAKRDVLTGT
jgi:hypothetical protein